MVYLAVETSCDETAVALVRSSGPGEFQILSEEISSQVELHEAYGGVVPELASREHLKNLPLLIERALHRAQLTIADLSGVAATRGPGLKGCLLIGLGAGAALAFGRGVPFVGVNHIEGHLLAPFLDCPDLAFPYLALVVSGGHTELVQVDGVGRYSVLARTTDDAAGEAFDKSAHLLGFTYPGGPKLAALADRSENGRFTLPKVMRDAEGFSFSGLKTAISMLIAKHRDEMDRDESVRGALARAIQDSIVDALVFKLERALKSSNCTRVVLTGGVAANAALRKRVSSLRGVTVYCPAPSHCTDNAAMIAYAGIQRLRRGERSTFDLEPLSRWPVEDLK